MLRLLIASYMYHLEMTRGSLWSYMYSFHRCQLHARFQHFICGTTPIIWCPSTQFMIDETLFQGMYQICKISLNLWLLNFYSDNTTWWCFLILFLYTGSAGSAGNTIHQKHVPGKAMPKVKWPCITYHYSFTTNTVSIIYECSLPCVFRMFYTTCYQLSSVF